MRTMSCWIVAAVAAGMFFVLPAAAEPVAPGESIEVDGDFELPTGTVLGDVTQNVTFEFDLGEGRIVRRTGTMQSRVIREEGASGLTFHYQFDDEPDVGPWESEAATIAGFAGFLTDVLADSAGTGAVVERSADGDLLNLSSLPGHEGIAGRMRAFVRTDAEAFDDDGTATYTLVDEFLVSMPEDDFEEYDNIGATVSVGGMFRPVAADGPAVIPLPPALIPGLLTLGGVALAGGVRRMRRGRRGGGGA